jgi:hypothetical protein
LSQRKFLARPERLELPTYWFEASRSIQLSYGRANAIIRRVIAMHVLCSVVATERVPRESNRLRVTYVQRRDFERTRYT